MQKFLSNGIWINSWLMLAVAIGVSGARLPAERIVLADPGVDGPVAEQVRHWQEKIRGGQRDRTQSFERLGWAFVNLGRLRSDAGFFKLAELSADAMDAQGEATPGADLLRGHAWLQQHRFADAENLARRLVADRGAPKDYALLADATMEQGKLAESVAACQELVNRQPGLEASVRIAQLRWLHGDLPGAIQAMAMANRVGGNLPVETTAWTQVRLGHFQLLAGEIDQAQRWADQVLDTHPDYAAAWLLRGQVELATGNTEGAVVALDRAAALNPLPGYVWWQAEALRVASQLDRATEIEATMAKHGAAADPRTLALFLATRRSGTDRAVTLATAELHERADAYTYDALAWSQWSAGNIEAAADSIERALATGLSDGRVWLHAGVIAAANGAPDQAATYLARANDFATGLMPSERALLAAATSATN
ncbi:tetratricopeptide repeat protein [Synoicihabitans lomoniglobus]|uniref:Tetratricopeptide repeat protein n=1 Tax=Synoicihabitans lomoniglobus TaxID=2909285 RepID=A0AAE9ZTT3_9BACT|nr:tetratricopeptide repeat protein [Opitutaceae bacterium LMO-M01]WED63972.1 tetratricopeptide repeat protein [Opitutaceae bacterium LMO-M01]